MDPAKEAQARTPQMSTGEKEFSFNIASRNLPSTPATRQHYQRRIFCPAHLTFF
jgi:hypothetical protein